MKRSEFVKALHHSLRHPLPDSSRHTKNVVIDWHVRSPQELDIEEARALLVKATQMAWLESIPNEFFGFKADYEFMEDYETDDWVYKLKFDPHEIYAHMPQQTVQSKVIYRLGDKEGVGVYYLGLDRFLEGSSKYAPSDSWDVEQVLESPLRSKDWKFGCENLDDVMKWIGSDENLHSLKSKGIFLWSIEVPAQHVVEGVCQVIFRDDHALRRRAYDLDELKSRLTLNETSLVSITKRIKPEIGFKL